MTATKIERFKIGDRVVVGRYGLDGYTNLSGKKGYICTISTGSFELGVCFDDKFLGGHTCRKTGEDARCRYGSFSEVRLLVENGWDD